MFKKRQKTKEELTEVATSHPLFTFSVIDKGMQTAARDYSSIKAYASAQQKGQSAKAPVAPAPTPAPVPVPPVPAPTPTPAATVKPPKKRLVSRFVLLSGLFILLAAGLGGGVLLWTLRQNEPTDVVTLPPNTNPPVTTPPVTTPPDNQTPQLRPEEQGKDTDSDGLSDAEERLYGTDMRNPDSDGDTYLDSNEVFHGYDPVTPAPSSLADSTVAKWYSYSGNPAFKFLKLNAWTIDVPTIVPERSRGSMRILATSGAEFRLTLHAREPQQTIGDWYDSQDTWKNKYGQASQLQPYASKQGYTGRITTDKRVVFLDINESTIAVFEYDLKTERTVEYVQTFQMMLNSFQLTAAVLGAPTLSP